MHFINNLNRGGAEILLLNICKGLLQKYSGYEFKIVILEDRQCLTPEFEKSGIEVICLNVIGSGFVDSLIGRFQKIIKSYQTIKRYNPDIVHTHLLLSDRFGLIAAFLAGVKNRICTVHSMERKRDIQDKISRFITTLFATKIITVSNSAKKFCINNKMYPKKKLYTICNAPGFTPKNILPKKFILQKEHFRIINVARFVEEKGQIYLINAIKELNNFEYKFELEIYGHGSLEKVLREEVAKQNITNIFFKGITSNIQAELKRADIFIASSLWEGFNMALVEAMSMGIPVIATNIPPHQELFQDTRDYPFLIETANSQGIVKAVLSLLASPDLYLELSIKCLEQAKRYSLDKMLKNYDTFYKTIL